MFGGRIKIMLEEQIVDPPIHYLTCLINFLYFKGYLIDNCSHMDILMV